MVGVIAKNTAQIYIQQFAIPMKQTREINNGNVALNRLPRRLLGSILAWFIYLQKIIAHRKTKVRVVLLQKTIRLILEH